MKSKHIEVLITYRMERSREFHSTIKEYTQTQQQISKD